MRTTALQQQDQDEQEQGRGMVVVAHPLTVGQSTFKSASLKSKTMALGTDTKIIGDDDSNNIDSIVTLAPGCTVMAEAAYILDSRTLRQVYPPPPLSTSKSNEEQPKQQPPTMTFLKITSPHSGYILSSIHSYPLLLPGLPTTYTNNLHWLWRVTCQPDGAYIRRGLELVTDHIGTLPYGTVCTVQKKVVNGMGLNRLKVEAYLENGDLLSGGVGKNINQSGHANDSDVDAASSFGMTKYSGYISEFLNPLSGQRGNVVEPIPFPVPALYKVIHPKGCIIRSGVELSTTQIGFAPAGAILSIVGRSFSDHPGHNCIERLKLAGGGGWISVSLNKRPPGNETLVTMMGVDGTFDPNDPSKFHFESMRKVMEELHANNNSGNGGSSNNGLNASGCREARAMFRRLSSYADLSEIGEDDVVEQNQQQSSSSIPDNEDNAAASSSGLGMSTRNSAAAAAVPTLFRSGVVGGGYNDTPMSTSSSCGLPAMDAIRESSSDSHHHNSNMNRCLICLSDERTATIVHGETGHIACCLTCARILKARGDNCPVCRLPIDLVIQQFWA
ncbi:hypothetical protein ACHAXR_004911 [Thalassiosira sp. AJA248-18]